MEAKASKHASKRVRLYSRVRVLTYLLTCASTSADVSVPRLAGFSLIT